ncbi:hypothetical protein FIBSPDRAFT_1002821 [Athelia psychrophila]|uniref:Uncharacterized protein n=1 Tax=Athelia psychrophila TaxID=1759441 RepID=A0A167WIS8_9AGAM|nr:hypothetical protein FIBSPDRAFT_1002821 [Fibularhizoctonia sp. CBS 109695]
MHFSAATILACTLATVAVAIPVQRESADLSPSPIVDVTAQEHASFRGAARPTVMAALRPQDGCGDCLSTQLGGVVRPGCTTEKFPQGVPTPAVVVGRTQSLPATPSAQLLVVVDLPHVGVAACGGTRIALEQSWYRYTTHAYDEGR